MNGCSIQYYLLFNKHITSSKKTGFAKAKKVGLVIAMDHTYAVLHLWYLHKAQTDDQMVS